MSGSDSYPRLFAAALLDAHPGLDNDRRLELMAGLSEAEVANEQSVIEALAGVREPSGKSGRPSRIVLDKARRAAESWLEKSIYFLNTEGYGGAGPKAGPPFYFAQGPRKLLEGRRAVILNSRTPRLLDPGADWIMAVKSLAKLAAQEKCSLLSSLGAAQYDLADYLAKRSDLDLILILPDPLPDMILGREESFRQLYGWLLDREKTLLLSPYGAGRLPPRLQRLLDRDKRLIGLAQLILVAEVRPRGNMEALITEALRAGSRVIVHDQGKIAKTGQGVVKWLDWGAETRRPTASQESDSPKINQLRLSRPDDCVPAESDDSPYLFHFTRPCPGPWPGQGLEEYYEALVTGHPGAAHTAFDTLIRILEESRIRGGSRLTRGDDAITSFTACDLGQIQKLIKWRRGLLRWTWTPYGIAVKRDALKKLGAKPVIHGNENVWHILPDRDRFRFQLYDPPKTDWKSEREWRLTGDLVLNDLSGEDWRVMVTRQEEAAEIQLRFGLKTILSKNAK